jgi:hypothetical protein
MVSSAGATGVHHSCCSALPLLLLNCAAVGAAIERCCSSSGSGGLWQEETLRIYARLQLQQVLDTRSDLLLAPIRLQRSRLSWKTQEMTCSACSCRCIRIHFKPAAAAFVTPQQVQLDRANVMAMQQLRARTAFSTVPESNSTSSAANSAASVAESTELMNLRQQLAASQASVLELQLEQVCFEPLIRLSSCCLHGSSVA